MANELKLRRGSSAATAGFTGAVGELTMDQGRNGLALHDGVTPGGMRVPNEQETTQAVIDYAAMKAYVGKARAFVVTGAMGTAKAPGYAGTFTRTSDTTTPEDGGTVFIGPDGKRIKRVFRGEVMAAWFGVVGDRIADDTAAARLAIASSATYKRVLNFEDAAVRQTGELVFPANHPGFRFSRKSYGHMNVADPGFYADVAPVIAPATAPVPYVAVTVSGVCDTLHGTVYGNGNANHGFRLDNVLTCHNAMLRAFNLVGFGVKLEKCWDNRLASISAELCGSTTEYAFSMIDAGDTCNETNIAYLQVEQAGPLAIYVSPNSLQCTIGLIHSERGRPAAPVADPNNAGAFLPTPEMYVLGGNRCTYNTVRIDSYNSENCRVILRGSNTAYHDCVTEHQVNVQVEGVNGSSIDINNMEVQGTLSPVLNQIGQINVSGGSIALLQGSMAGFRVSKTRIAKLNFGNASFDQWNAVFEKLTIGEVTRTAPGTSVAATFDTCIIKKATAFPNNTVLHNCHVLESTPGAILAVAYGELLIQGGQIDPEVTANNCTVVTTGARLLKKITRIAGSNAGLFDSTTRLDGGKFGY